MEAIFKFSKILATNISWLTLGKEPLLKGKVQYSWPPCTD